ncbi:MAG: adenosylcobinamide-GDP ribazoletransferase [Alphaproteobacteria bacterium]|nr:adenosylcobinamide-GDP ribazoletransferase [Alphaproteobacteria bacterium]
MPAAPIAEGAPRAPAGETAGPAGGDRVPDGSSATATPDGASPAGAASGPEAPPIPAPGPDPAVAPASGASGATEPKPARDRPWNWFGEVRLALVFLTILPIRLRPQDMSFGVSHAVRAFPIAGIPVGAAAALAYAAADLAGLAPMISALLAVAAAAIMSGGLHEDGLADTADGLGGGRTREQRLAIMRDSRIGAFGALALILAIGLRVNVIGNLGVTADAVSALIGAAIASRTAMATVMFLLPPARNDGLSHAAGIPDRSRTADSVMIGVLLTALALAYVAEPVTILAAMCGTAAGAVLPALAARVRLGGQTGDVLGAVQQCAEIGFLLVFIANP